MGSKRTADLEARLAQQEEETVRSLRREIDRLRREITKHRSGAGLIMDAVEQVLRDNPPDLRVPASPKRDRRRKSEEVAVLHVSDTQIGKVTETYDSSVCEARLMRLAEKVAHITEVRRSASKVDDLRIYLGGDMVEGEDIFPGQAHQIDSSVFEQAFEGASMLARMIEKLLGVFPSVRVVCVPGNHGRVSRFSHPGTNWDRVCYRALQLLLLDGSWARDAGLPKRLQIDAPDSWYAVDRIYEWGSLLAHGDQIRGGFAGFPWYGTAKKAWGWIDSIDEPWDYLWIGHFHTYASAVLNHRTFLANGTTESSNAYAQEQLAAGGHPCQRLSFFDADHGLIADHQVFLTDEGDRLPAKRKAERWHGAGAGN